MLDSTVRCPTPDDELNRSCGNLVGATLPPLPSPPDPCAPSLYCSMSGKAQMLPYSTFGRSSTETCRRPLEVMALNDGRTEIKSPRLGEGECRVSMYGIPPHWTVSKMQEIISDMEADIRIKNYTPVGKERIMPDDRYNWQKRDCEIVFKDRSAAQRFLAVFPLSTEGIQARCHVFSGLDDQAILADEKPAEPELGRLIQLHARNSVHSPIVPDKGSSACSPPFVQISALYDTVRPYDAKKFRDDVKSGVWQGRPSVKDLGFDTWEIRGYRDDRPDYDLTTVSEEIPSGTNCGPPAYMPGAPSPPLSVPQYPSPTRPVHSPVPWANTTGPEPLDHYPKAAEPTQKLRDPYHDMGMGQSGETLAKHRDSLPKDSTWRIHGTRSPDDSVKSSGIHAVVENMIVTHRPGRYIVPCLPEDRGDFIDLATLRISPLAPDITSHFLKNVFGSICPDYGDIISIKVMLDPQGRSRGFGFVSFRDPDIAAYAKAILLDIRDPLGFKLSSIKYPLIQLEEVHRVSRALPGKSVLPGLSGLQSDIPL